MLRVKARSIHGFVLKPVNRIARSNRKTPSVFVTVIVTKWGTMIGFSLKLVLSNLRELSETVVEADYKLEH